MGSYPLSSQAPTHVEVELGCDNIMKDGGGVDFNQLWAMLKRIKHNPFQIIQPLICSEFWPLGCANLVHRFVHIPDSDLYIRQ